MVEGGYGTVVDELGFQTVESKSKRRRRRKQNSKTTPPGQDSPPAETHTEVNMGREPSLVPDTATFIDENEDPLAPTSGTKLDSNGTAPEKQALSNGLASTELSERRERVSTEQQEETGIQAPLLKATSEALADISARYEQGRVELQQQLVVLAGEGKRQSQDQEGAIRRIAALEDTVAKASDGSKQLEKSVGKLEQGLVAVASAVADLQRQVVPASEPRSCSNLGWYTAAALGVAAAAGAGAYYYTYVTRRS
mmetsp:Transcript_4979/g.18043  ORF Transcript_4979/g.18043 Transcript_4979/m.18043 type:complete len:253 (-) Transcript_4979:1424-2182(-)|eukprot:scaffold1399_cov410-Prasinococcus_capsulatus_cf.AAC.35